MGNKYTLRYLPVAVDDLISIFDWIANDSPANAAAFVEKLDQRIGNLQTHPSLVTYHVTKNSRIQVIVSSSLNPTSYST